MKIIFLIAAYLSISSTLSQDHLSNSSRKLATASYGDFSLPTNSATVGSKFTLYYQVSGSNITIAIKCTVPSSFFSIGLGTSMTNSDIWIFEISNNQVVASDRWSSGYEFPGLDTALSGTSDVYLLGYEITDTYTVAKITRPLVTGDSKDKDIVIGSNNLIWAYKEGSGAVAYHESTKGTGTLNVVSNSGDYSLPSKEVIINSALSLYYEISSADITIAVKSKVPSSYFAIGWGTQMANSDIWTFEISNNAIVASDRYVTSYAFPMLDTAQGGTNDIALLGYEITSAYSIAKVKRNFNTSDSKDTAIVAGTNSLIWAYKTGNSTLDYHDNRGVTTVSLSTNHIDRYAWAAALIILSLLFVL